NGPLGVTAGTNYPTIVGSPPTVGNPALSIATQGGIGTQVIGFNIGTLNASDVGQQAVVIVLPAETKAPGQAAEVNSGDGEGTTVSIDIPAVNTINLAINGLAVGNSDTNMVSEYEVDYAIQGLANIRAQVGAQTVSLQETANNAAIDSVNTQASESLIRDTDIGKETTAFTKDQILVNLQTAVLSKLFGQAPQVLALVQGSRVGSSGI
ncbi:MAG TPA: flagellin, partial [Caballeronia sp.]|nr:flagellin [Caballeronia sp.]